MSSVPASCPCAPRRSGCVDLTLMPGEVVAITGSSGSGKSSLLHCLAGVLAPSAGSVSFEGRRYGSLGDEELSALRRERFVARALVHQPTVVFADEPTGALDSVNAATVLDEFLTLARDRGTAVLLVTHDEGVASHADRRYVMCDGRISLGRGVPAPAVGEPEPAPRSAS
ncbi:ATP-binding cassette domain-containing protein [Streptomyces sp. NPDC058373]|uniref:ATP-binding cassette domain-containing protein n=1 Tax=Streptomyces sp. NPDC058373 TaxID=3346465 RepID=UPI00365EC406